MNRLFDCRPLDGSAYRSIALIADSHGPLHPAVARKLTRYDCIVHAGDLGGWAVLGDFIQPVHAVSGNNDVAAKWPTAERRLLQRLPECLRISLPGGDLVVIHGHQFPAAKTRHQRLRNQFADARAVVYGHSHRLLLDRSAKPWVLNPGASGQARTYGGASFIGLTVRGARWSLREVRA